MSDVNVKDCLRKWRKKYGEQRTGKAHGQTYWSIPISNRRELIKIFLRWMRMIGLQEERFRKATFQAELIDICFGTAPAFNEKKRKGGHEALKEELEDILATEGIFTGKRTRTNKNAKPSIKPVIAPTILEVKTVGRDIGDKYGKEEKPVLDPEWAKLMGVTEDE